MRRHLLLVFIVLFSAHRICDAAPAMVATIKKTVEGLPPVDVKDTEKFLNDLKLSPFWKVEKTRDGDFAVYARGIEPTSPFEESGRRFLFEQSFEPEGMLPLDWRLNNRGVAGGEKVTSLQASILFKRPEDATLSFVPKDRTASLNIYSLFDGKKGLDGNAFSLLAVKLSETQPVYLVIREQGSDKDREATFRAAVLLTKQLDAVAKLPAKYRVREQYATFFKTLFPEPPKDVNLKRLHGDQDRDAFYGYFRTKADLSYEGINIKVSHTVYANGEATRETDRRRKAEYLGKPTMEDDWLFFAIEDNAVYLLPQYNKDFGTFSGTKTFQGKLEILNDGGKVLYESMEPFKGWER